MANFGPNHGLFIPFGKMSIFPLYELLIFMTEKSVSWFQNITKHIFLAYNASNKFGKMANFGPKPWTNPFGKMTIFQLFELLLFITQKGVSSFQNIIRLIFLAYIESKIMFENWPILDQNHRQFWTKTMDYSLWKNVYFSTL